MGASTRRIATPGSAIWHSMLDGAEDILREEGYGALTSRAVADRLGVKQRLVYYYFRTMDELIVETFRRLAVRETERLDNALKSESPLREIWDVSVHTTDARMVAEFMALANRSAALRKEVTTFIDTTRKIQVQALKQAMAGQERKSLPCIAMAIFATSAALAVHREEVIGLKSGHKEVLQVIKDFIEQYEPASTRRNSSVARIAASSRRARKK